MYKVGEFNVKGLAYEDVINILGNNGYAVEIFIPAHKVCDVNTIEHIIKVYKEEDQKEVE